MANCIVCGSFTLSGDVCALCGNKAHVNEIKARQEEAKLRTAQAPKDWRILTQDAPRVEQKHNADIRASIDEFMNDVMGCVSHHIDDDRASSFGDQYTIWTHESNDNATVDFQGVRAGSSGSFWVDLQGQDGGGGTKRKTYCQVMVQLRRGVPPPELVTEAFERSLDPVAGRKRFVIYDHNTRGQPV